MKVNIATLPGLYPSSENESCQRLIKMLFLMNELAKKPEITILPARETTGPGLQAGASWVERKRYIRGSVARDSHLGL